MKLFAILFCLVLSVSGVWAQSSSDMSTQSSDSSKRIIIEQFDKDILRYQKQKSNGSLMIVLGSGVCVLGILNVPYETYEASGYGIKKVEHGNPALYYMGVIAGGGLLAYGFVSLSEAKKRIKILERKKRSFAFSPSIHKDGLGVQFTYRF